ncbi:hypothetical protein BD413DRAFT_609812 [Trametes elegans]|nr:hypothetical protein BD413DRAFT_609812 [Trametes elegans]
MPAFRTRKTAATRKAKQTVVCDICGVRLAGDLKRHMKTHYPPELECTWPGCFHKTSQRTNLKTHLNTHTRKRPSRCRCHGWTSTGW